MAATGLSGNQVRRLVERAKRSDLQAFKELYRIFRDPVLGLIRSRGVENYQDILDVCQETFIRAYRGIKRFKEEAPIGESSFKKWLFKIAANEVKTFQRVSQRRVPRDRIVPLEQPINKGQEGGKKLTIEDILVSNQLSPSDLVLLQQRMSLWLEVINKIPNSSYRKLLILDLQVASAEEIAEELGISVKSVPKYRQRAIAEVRKVLARYPEIGNALEFEK